MAGDGTFILLCGDFACARPGPCVALCGQRSLLLVAGSKVRTLMEQEEVFCDEFHLVDLRVYDNCKKVVRGCEHVFNLAADMGGAWWFESVKHAAWVRPAGSGRC